jgi:nitrate/nitrite transporter NarK
LDLLLSIPLFAICKCPLLPEIAMSLHLTISNMWFTNIYSMVGGIRMGLVLGPVCDQYGVRILITHSLLGGAIPCLCTGLIFNLHK